MMGLAGYVSALWCMDRLQSRPVFVAVKSQTVEPGLPGGGILGGASAIQAKCRSVAGRGRTAGRMRIARCI